MEKRVMDIVFCVVESKLLAGTRSQGSHSAHGFYWVIRDWRKGVRQDD